MLSGIKVMRFDAFSTDGYRSTHLPHTRTHADYMHAVRAFWQCRPVPNAKQGPGAARSGFQLYH